MTDGNKANESGLGLENKVEKLIIELTGATLKTNAKSKSLNKAQVEKIIKTSTDAKYTLPTLVKQEYYLAPILKSLKFVDYRLIDVKKDIDVVIECKNQNVAGSVEEKFEAILLRLILNSYHTKQFILLLDGSFWTDIKKQADVAKYKACFKDINTFLKDYNLILDKDYSTANNSVMLFSDFCIWLKGKYESSSLV
jgi:hypothetical protein